MRKSRFKVLFSSLFSFIRREQRGVLILLPLMVAISIIFFRFRRADIDESFLKYSDAVIETPAAGAPFSATAETTITPANRAADSDKKRFFTFDPNIIDLEGLVSLGFSQRQAQGIINYRNAGAKFRKAEDFAKCYTVSDEKFRELLPYINIEADIQPLKVQAADKEESVSEEEVRSDSGNTYSELSQNAAAKDSLIEDLPQTPALLELNTADSAALVSVRGIGAVTAVRILRYRELLGGYASSGQLTEIVGMTEQNYQMILQQIFIDNSKIQKIDINFATPQQMRDHPYLPARVLDKILKQRQLKGGWSTTEDLIKENILTEEQAARLSPYLYFSER